MKTLRLLLLLCCGCASIPGLHVTRSLTDKNVASKPAQLQVTMPKDQDRSYAVDFGLGYTHTTSKTERRQTDLTLGAEYHRNTLADKKQDTTLVSLALEKQLGNFVPDKGTPDDTVYFPTLAAKYKKDRIKGTQSIMPILSATLASKPLRIGTVNGSSVGWIWQPTLGTEWERVYRAANNAPTGSTGRLWGSLDLDVFPLFRRSGSQLDLALTGRIWYDASQSRALDTGRDRHYLRKATLTYFIDKDQHFGIGLDRVSGENPSEGQPNQHYTQLSLKLKL